MIPTSKNPLGQLTSWSLNDFKAIEAGSVSFPGLTVLLGANSSGKSSLIQSVLSCAQVIQGNFGNRFPLSGELTRLGDISQVSHKAKGSFELIAGFEFGRVALHIAQDEIGRYLAPGDMNGEFAEARASKITLEWGTIARGEGPKQFQIEVIDLDEDGDLDHRIAMGDVSRKDVPLARYKLSGHFECFGVCAEPQASGCHELSGKTTVKWKPSSPTFRLGEGYQNLSFANFDEVVQNALWFDEEANPEQADLQNVLSEIRESHSVTDEGLVAVLDEIKEFFSQQVDEQRVDTTAGLFNILSSQLRPTLWRLVNILEEYLEDSLERQVASRIEEIVSSDRWIRWSDDMPICWGEWQEKFNLALKSIHESIAYLGPLRLDPQTLQSPNGSTNSCIPVGRSGENATHLIWQSERDKTFKPFPTADGLGTESLTEAISSWLAYLELGSPVVFRNLGIAGFETLVKGLPLYNLGTGVSQMLPLLALCLNTHGDRVVLIEQPELHLHPSAQQKLADFLIAMVESGRRLVVETHSEYLITRLRRRVAVDGVNPSKYQLVFVEKAEGRSTFKTSKLNDTGQFSYWPDGFFGQVEDDLISILEADVRKSPE